MFEDDRNELWADLEADIQSRAEKKDSDFKLSGSWKRFLRKQDGYWVYVVDGEWIRNNLSIIFGHGGHGCVHEFIPLDEIWVATHHFDGCGCITRSATQECSNEYFESTVLHEIVECEVMRKGATFWEAHNIAIQREEEVGWLENLLDDSGLQDNSAQYVSEESTNMLDEIVISITEKDIEEFLEQEAAKPKCRPETCGGQCQGMGSCQIARGFRDDKWLDNFHDEGVSGVCSMLEKEEYTVAVPRNYSAILLFLIDRKVIKNINHVMMKGIDVVVQESLTPELAQEFLKLHDTRMDCEEVVSKVCTKCTEGVSHEYNPEYDTCINCNHWSKDKSRELNMIAFRGMSGWEDAKSEGYCSIRERWGIEFDDTCEKFSRI